MVKSILLALGAFVLVTNVVSADDSSSALPNCSCKDDQATISCCSLGEASDNECKLFNAGSVPGFKSCCMRLTGKQGEDAFDCKDEYGSS